MTITNAALAGCVPDIETGRNDVEPHPSSLFTAVIDAPHDEALCFADRIWQRVTRDTRASGDVKQQR
jgi:hypothetical protein